MEVCKKINVSLSNIHVFGVTTTEHNVLWSYFHDCFIVISCQYFNVNATIELELQWYAKKTYSFNRLEKYGNLPVRSM